VCRDPGGGRSGVEADAAVVPALHAAAEATEGDLLRLRRGGGLCAGSHHSQARSRRLHGACGRGGAWFSQVSGGWFGPMGESCGDEAKREEGGMYRARRVVGSGFRVACLGRELIWAVGGSESEGDPGLFVSIARAACLLCRVTLWFALSVRWGRSPWIFPCGRALGWL
jgi:hypothetical protein